MQNEVGSVRYRIYGDNSQFKSDVGDSKAIAENAASSIGQAFKKAMAAAGVAIVSAVTLGIKYNAQIEQYSTAFKTLTGSAEEAQSIIEQIKKDAAVTPFGVAELTQANQLLMSTGVNAEKSRKTILALGDAVSSTGGGNDELVRMAQNLQQVQNAGVATAMDIRQFAMAGIDVYGILASYLGKSTAEIKDMNVSFDDLSNALIAASSQGGRYFGAMGAQSKTFNGQLSTLKDNIKDKLGEAVKSISSVITTKLLPAAIKFVNNIDVNKLVKQVGALYEKFKSMLPVLLSTFALAIKFKLSLGIVGAVIKVTSAINSLSKLLETGINIAPITKAFTSLGAVLVSGPWGAVAIVLGVMAAAAAALLISINRTDEAVAEHTETLKANYDAAKSAADSYKELRSEQEKTAAAGMAQLANASALSQELFSLADSNGRVADADKSRASFILNELNSALGTEYQMNGNLIAGYKEMQGSILGLIEVKRSKILLDAMEAEYNQAIINQAAEQQRYTAAAIELEQNRQDQVRVGIEVDKYAAQLMRATSQGASEAEIARITAEAVVWSTQADNLRNYGKTLVATLQQSSDSLDTYDQAIYSFESAWQAASEGNYQAVQDIYNNTQRTTEEGTRLFKSAQEQQLTDLANAVVDAQVEVERYGELYGTTLPAYAEKGAKKAQEELAKAIGAFEAAGGQMVDGIVVGADRRTSALASKFAALGGIAVGAFNKRLEINSPSRVFGRSTDNIILGITKKIDEDTPKPVKAMSGLAEKMRAAFAVERPVSPLKQLAQSSSSSLNVTLDGVVEMDGYRVGKVVLRNLDDVVAQTVKGASL